jgi:hypothetical protein
MYVIEWMEYIFFFLNEVLQVYVIDCFLSALFPRHPFRALYQPIEILIFSFIALEQHKSKRGAECIEYHGTAKNQFESSNNFRIKVN